MKAPMYQLHAKDYAEAISDNIYNAHLERPSMLRLLPDLAGLDVLDLGCGPGLYAQYLVEQGARVTAVDAFAEMVDLTQTRCGPEVRAYVQDCAAGLPMEENQSYDLVVCPLMIHYLEDWHHLLADVNRVLRPGGEFIFSTHHPMVDFESSPSGNYFLTEMVEETWETTGQPVEVQFFRRPLSAVFAALAQAGFYVAELSEGRPSTQLQDISMEAYQRLSTHPSFMYLRCRSLAG